MIKKAKAATAKTTITESSAQKWLKDAKPRQTLFCKNIPGFHLIKTKTGASWRYRYHDQGGKERSFTIARFNQMTPAQAATVALDWRVNGTDVFHEKQEQYNQRKEAERLAKARQLGLYLETVYTQHQSKKRDGKQAISRIRNGFAEWLGRDMDSLARADVVAWQARREAEGKAHTTNSRVYGAVKTLLNHAVKNELLNANPLEKVYLERPATTERTRELSAKREAARRLLKPDEIQGIHRGLMALDEEIRQQRRNSRKHGKPHLPDLDEVVYPYWLHPFTLVAMYTGLRPGDIYTLTWHELSLPFKRLTKVPNKTADHSNPAKITMPLPDSLIRVLTIWWQQQGEPTAGYVFPSERVSGPMDSKAHNNPWRKVKRLGGLPDELSFYSLRHNFISQLVSDGVPLLSVAQLVGHKSAEMIERHYGHLCPMTAANAMQAFSQKMEPSKAEYLDTNFKSRDAV